MNQPLQHTVSITDVAEGIATLETYLPISARFAGDPDGIVRDRRMNPFLGWETMPTTLRVYRLRHGAMQTDKA
jgi:hypothetical protein